MEVRGTRIAGLYVFIPAPFRDDRGFFVRTFDAEVAATVGIDGSAFVQDSQSRSAGGTVRGLHLRTDGREAKLVRCARGALFDVVVDVRAGSATFGVWESFLLDDVDHRSIHIPPGCAHGFQALTDPADTCYRMDAPYAPGLDATIAWNDPELAIPWPLAVTSMSAKDAAAASLADYRVRLSGAGTSFGAT